MTSVVNVRIDQCDIYIGRGSIWGNPYRIGIDGTRSEVIEKYRSYIISDDNLMNEIHKLRGKRLGCFCKPKACHGDVLLEIIEKEENESSIDWLG